MPQNAAKSMCVLRVGKVLVSGVWGAVAVSEFALQCLWLNFLFFVFFCSMCKRVCERVH